MTGSKHRMPGASTLAPPGLVARSLGSTDTPRVLAPQSAAADIGARQVRRRHAGHAGHQVPDAVEIKVGASLGARGGGGGHLAGVGRRMADHIIANTSRLCRPAICSPLARARSRPAPLAAMLESTMCYEEGQCTC
jgi:hypothetical protein